MLAGWRAQRYDWKFVIASAARQSACWFVILSAVKDLNLRKQADCHAPSCHHKGKVIPVAGARSDGLAAACVRWAKLAGAARVPVSSSLQAKRGNLPVSLSLRAKRGNPPLFFLFFIARCAATQRYPKGHFVRLLVSHPELSEGSYPQETGRLPRPLLSSQGKGHSSGGGSQ